LLVKMMAKGKITYDLPSLEQIRQTCLENLSRLPQKYKKLRGAPTYPVETSRKLNSLIESLKLKLKN